MPHAYTIRQATPSDSQRLIAFTLEEARDAQGMELDVASATRGVEAAFATPGLASYWVAETDAGDVVASTSVVTEWSNFHGANYWWIQSLFIVAAHRGWGLVEQLLDHLANEAAAHGALDLRLYAHESNERALRVYGRCGFSAAPYRMMIRRPPTV